MDMQTTPEGSKRNSTSDLSMLELLFDTNRYRVVSKTLGMKQIAYDLIQDYGLEEAFFVCDLGELLSKHAEWLQFLPRVRPFYAVKCNDSPLVLETLAGLGTGFDCASKVEMAKVLQLGVSPSDIIYANPAKPRSHILAADSFGIKTVTFDSETELYKLQNLLPGARLVVRIRCEAAEAQCPLGMKFGVSLPEACDLLRIAKSLSLNVIGVSFHVGSGCRDPPVFLRAIAQARYLFDYASDQFDYEFTLLDIGGGFPGAGGTSIAEIASVVNTALDRFFPQGCGVNVIAEPGRYYVASAFTLNTQIHSIREVKGQDLSRYMYYINDGIYGSFNCIMYDHNQVHPELIEEKAGAKYECSIWGPTCDGLDQVCVSELLPKMEIGEWLSFPDMGAYTLVAGGTFNGFPLPKLHTIASEQTWNILKNFLSCKAFVIDDIDVDLKAGVGFNRDAVGWGFVQMAVVGKGSQASTEDGQDKASNSDEEVDVIGQE